MIYLISKKYEKEVLLMSLAIITGASSGIGAEFARQLARRGVDEFWFVARRRERMVSLGEELGVKYKVIEADLATRDGTDAVLGALRDEHPPVKYFVSAAGFGDFGGFDEITPECVEKMIDLNVKASVTLTHAVIPFMERGGRIITLGSGSAFTPLPYFNVYAAGKAFILHYTKALNYEIKKYGLRATCFCPGWVETEFIDKAAEREDVTMPKPSALHPLLNCERAVRGCIRAAERGRSMYVTGLFTKTQHVLYKLLPDSVLSRAWLAMLNTPRQRREK